jgi:peptidyl-prolyl cis-trans isomerase SurA
MTELSLAGCLGADRTGRRKTERPRETVGVGRPVRRWARAFAPAAVVALLAFVTPSRAQVVLFVNGDPVTNLDIEQRAKLVQLMMRKSAPRQELIDDIINDKLKIQVAKRYRVDVTEADVEKQFAEMGGRMRMSRQQFEQVLTQNGVEPATMKEHIKAEISWATILQGKFQQNLQVNEKDVLQAMESGNTSDDKDKKEKKDGKDGGEADKAVADKAVAYEYTLRPILFVVARGASSEIKEARKKEAEALRTRFENCDSGLRLARAIRDVAIREPITKSSTDLQPAIREILDRVPVGRLTASEVTTQGVQVFALCGKHQAKNDARKKEVQSKLFTEKYEAQGKRYLQELRKGAMIEWKETPEPVKEIKGKKGAKASKESNAGAPGVKTQ